jgi:aspartate aminotransferase
MDLSGRVRQLNPSPTLAITAKTMSMRAQGVDVVSFGAGEPDFDTPDHIKKAAIQAIDGGFTKYTPVGGIDELKDAIIEKFRKDNELSYERSQILVSSGGKHAIYNLAQALFEPGDEVIIPAPFWVSYPSIVELAGATPVIIDTSEAEGFRIAPDRLREAITPRTKALILNSPSNPTGAAYASKELEDLAEIVLDKGIYVISDEIYEKIVFDGFRFTSIASLDPEIKDRTIIVHGVSKTYAMTGWRIGFTAGPAELIRAMASVQSQSTSNPTSIAQKAAVVALTGPQEPVKEMVSVFQERRNLIVSRLTAILGIPCLKPQGAFYVFPNFSSWFGRTYEAQTLSNSVELANYFLTTSHVALVPGLSFGAEGYERLSFATSTENIQKGLDRIEEALSRLTSSH